MFKLRNFTLVSTKWAHFKCDACYRSQKSWHGGNKGLKKQDILKTTLKTMFLNIKLKRLCKSHHLQCITSSIRFRGTGEISVCGWRQGWRHLLDGSGLQALRRHCITHQHDSVIDITKWAQEYFQKPLSVNTICRAICRCQLKLYHTKRKPCVNMVQKRRRVLWAKAHLKWTVSKWRSVLWSDESKFYILVGYHGRRVLQAKEEGKLLACYQRSVQKPASLMVWGCISGYSMDILHVLERTMTAERYIKVLEQHMLPSRWHLFQERPCVFQQDTTTRAQTLLLAFSYLFGLTFGFSQDLSYFWVLRYVWLRKKKFHEWLLGLHLVHPTKMITVSWSHSSKTKC